MPGRPAKYFESDSIKSCVHAVAIGILNFLAKLLSSFTVDESLTPVPARIRGFSDASSKLDNLSNVFLYFLLSIFFVF